MKTKLLLIIAILVFTKMAHADPIIVKEPDGKTYRKEEINVPARQAELVNYIQEMLKQLQYIQDKEAEAQALIAQAQKELTDIQAAK